MTLQATLYLFLLPLMLAMQHFSVSVSNGIGEGVLKPGTPLKTALLFAIITFFMVIAGDFAGRFLEGRTDIPHHGLAFLFLLLIGMRMVWHAWKKKASQRIFDINQVPVIFALALALSINMLFVGLALNFLDISTMRFAFTLSAAVLLLSFSGLLYGNQFGDTLGWKMELVAGIYVLGAGVALLAG